MLQKIAMKNSDSGIGCNVCRREHIIGMRYTCLVCVDYDMCEECFITKKFNAHHKPYHSIQAVLPYHEFEASTGSVAPDDMRIYCCPYCGEKEFSSRGLVEHCRRFHVEGGFEVRCPVCIVTGQLYTQFLPIPLLEHLLDWHGENEFSGLTADFNVSDTGSLEFTVYAQELEDVPFHWMPDGSEDYLNELENVTSSRGLHTDTAEFSGLNGKPCARQSIAAQEEPDCSICMEKLLIGAEPTHLQCAHGFHSTCITRWLESNPICPVCRVQVNPRLI